LERVIENTSLMIRIGSWFVRCPETLWQADETAALVALGEVTKSEMKLLEWWFLEAGEEDTTDKDDERNFKRQRIIQLLNNWSGEIDRVNKFKQRDDLVG